MLKVKIGEDNYEVSFFHENVSEISKEFKAVTLCQIIQILDDDHFVQKHEPGFAFCSSKDMFNKYTGAKLALSRALRMYSKSERIEFWKEFAKSFSHKKTAPILKQLDITV